MKFLIRRYSGIDTKVLKINILSIGTPITYKKVFLKFKNTLDKFNFYIT